jgi:hypothetical protein
VTPRAWSPPPLAVLPLRTLYRLVRMESREALALARSFKVRA